MKNFKNNQILILKDGIFKNIKMKINLKKFYNIVFKIVKHYKD